MSQLLPALMRSLRLKPLLYTLTSTNLQHDSKGARGRRTRRAPPLGERPSASRASLGSRSLHPERDTGNKPLKLEDTGSTTSD